MKISNLGAVALVVVFCILVSFQGNTPPQNPQTVTIVLTIPEAEVVLEALNELPFKKAAPVINNIMAQAQKQMQPVPVVPKADAQKPKVDSTNKKKQ